MKVVDVLCDQMGDDAQLLEFDEGAVARVRLSLLDGLCEAAVVPFFEAALPPATRVPGESVVLVEWRLTVDGPETSLAAVGGDPGLFRHTGTGEYYGMSRAGEEVRRHFEGRRVGAAIKGVRHES